LVLNNFYHIFKNPKTIKIMSHFSVKVNYKSGKPASDVGVIIDYGWPGVPIKKEPTRMDG
jgi:hypothetical protein